MRDPKVGTLTQGQPLLDEGCSFLASEGLQDPICTHGSALQVRPFSGSLLYVFESALLGLVLDALAPAEAGIGALLLPGGAGDETGCTA